MLIPVVALALLPLLSAVLILRAVSIGRKMGAPLWLLNRRPRLQFLGVLVCSPLLIAVNLLRDFGPVTVFVISLTGLLAFAIALTDLLYSGMMGVYENGIVWNSVSVCFSSVTGFNWVDPYTLSLRITGRSNLLLSNPFQTNIGRLAECLEDKLSHPR